MEVFGRTERLLLRRMTAADFDEVALIMRGRQVREIWEHAFTDADVRDWIDKNISYYEKYQLGYFLALKKDTDTVVGQIALMPDEIDGKTYYEVGYILKEEFTGQGFATEGAQFMINYAFDVLKLDEIIFEIRPENERSLKVAQKLGAKLSGSFIKTVRGKEMKHFIFSKEPGK